MTRISSVTYVQLYKLSSHRVSCLIIADCLATSKKKTITCCYSGSISVLRQTKTLLIWIKKQQSFWMLANYRFLQCVALNRHQNQWAGSFSKTKSQLIRENVECRAGRWSNKPFIKPQIDMITFSDKDLNSPINCGHYCWSFIDLNIAMG